MCQAASSHLSGSPGQIQNTNLLLLFFFADDSCPKPPEIPKGYVEHMVRYHCQTYYKLRTAGDGTAWMSISGPSPIPPFP